jgi:hypothetical protein
VQQRVEVRRVGLGKPCSSRVKASMAAASPPPSRYWYSPCSANSRARERGGLAEDLRVPGLVAGACLDGSALIEGA